MLISSPPTDPGVAVVTETWIVPDQKKTSMAF
jgi:hypothetical protein